MDNANKSPEAKEGPGGNTSATSRVAHGERDACELFVFEARGQLFAVPVDEVAGTAEQVVPAKLPLAPAAVLGVVCVRGRMLTVIDPPTLVNRQRSESPAVVPLVVILRGDDQLALAADRRADTLRVRTNEIRPDSRSEGASTPQGTPPAESAVLGSVHRNSQQILVLDPGKLFAAAMGKSERRRRRT